MLQQNLKERRLKATEGNVVCWWQCSGATIGIDAGFENMEDRLFQKENLIKGVVTDYPPQQGIHLGTLRQINLENAYEGNGCCSLRMLSPCDSDKPSPPPPTSKPRAYRIKQSSCILSFSQLNENHLSIPSFQRQLKYYTLLTYKISNVV